MARQAHEADRKRGRYQEMAAEGLIGFDELTARMAELEENTGCSGSGLQSHRT